MKTLNNYVQQAQTEALDKYGAFFAFSNKQFDEQRKDNVIYRNMGTGLICPSQHCQALFDELAAIAKRGREQDIAENGAEAIIKRELYNHECFYTGDPSDAIDALEGYGFTKEQIIKVYVAEAPNADQW
ncbi:TPA: hypothetical protein NGR52_004258 [Vibrio parahaemolyticus]|nr:hypothetical protein [Vibrio parahaemolyticus]